MSNKYYLAHLGLESLQVRKLKCDNLLCYKIIHYEVVIRDLDFLVFSDCAVTRTQVQNSNVTQMPMHTRLFYTNRICDVWESLPDLVVDARSVTAFRRLLDRVDESKHALRPSGPASV